MSLVVEIKQQPEVPLEVDWFSPANARGCTIDELRSRKIFHGNQPIELGEFFDLSGSLDDQKMVWHGDLSNVHWIGKNMSTGEMLIEDSVGRHLGSEMSGGSIEIKGNAGDWVGAEMTGGQIRIAGNAGNQLGAAYRGSPRGVAGGTILVNGNAGDEIGRSMRRGMIAIAGRVGDMLGFNMLAGSIFVFGHCGIRPGAGMKRGTIGLFGQIERGMLPTFRKGALLDSVIFRLIERELESQDFKHDLSKLSEPLRVYHGDQLAGGRGEILAPGLAKD